MRSCSVFQKFIPILIPILIFIKCAFDTDKNNLIKVIENPTINWHPNEVLPNIDIETLVNEINFIPLSSGFTPRSAPDKFRIYKEHIYMLWRNYKKLGKYTLNGLVKDSIVTVADSKMNLGPLLDFDFHNDSLYLLHGEKISVFSEFNFKKESKTINLTDFYNTFTITKKGFYLYSSESSHFLTHTDFNNSNIKFEFPTNTWPIIRGDYFPHFAKSSNQTIFCHPYNPTLYKINNQDSILSKYLTLNMGQYSVDLEEVSKIKISPNDRNSQLAIASTNFCYFDDLLHLQNSFLFTFKLNGKFYYNIWNVKEQKLKSFLYFNNTTNIPFTVGKGLLDFIGSDGSKSLYAFIDPQYILSHPLKIKRINVQKIKSNWNEIFSSISLQSGPLLCELKLN